MDEGTYVMLCDIAGYISGAPIYYRNKAIFLEGRGWNVRIIASDEGRVYIEGLERFSVGVFPFIREDPAVLSRRQVARHIEEMVASIGISADGPVIIETGTDWTSYWGEALARHLIARHMIFFLDENNQRAKARISFFDFKRRRGEMACITKQTMVNLFSGYVDLNSDEAAGFRACCTNSVQDIENDFSNGLIRDDFNIGSIGRLDKPLVPGLIEEIKNFSFNHPEMSIQVVFFGGASPVVEESISHAFDSCANVRVVVSGYMWPIAKSSLEMMDVFASAAGSRLLSSSLGIPTVAMDVTGSGAIGFVGTAEVSESPLYRVPSNSNDSRAASYFERVLSGEVGRKADALDLAGQWSDFCLQYQRQLDMALNCASPVEYFDVSSFRLSKRDSIKRVLYHSLGEPMANRLLATLRRPHNGKA